MIPQSITGKAQNITRADNAVVRNTYLLLSLTLLFSAAMVTYATLTNAGSMGILLTLGGWFGLYFLTMALRNSGWGLLAIFAFTGFSGYTLGPLLNFYLHNLSNGAQIIATSLGATALVFIGLSAYAFTSRKNFSYLGGFIAIAAMSAFILGLGAIFFHMPMLQLLISGAFAIISSAYILYTTSAIINGGEKNYIMATIMLYVAIFNLFVSLLRILSFFTGGGRN